MQSVPGKAYGTELSSSTGPDDSSAVLTGTWGPDQTVQGTIRHAAGAGNPNAEIEIRVRSSISAHVNSGYEVNFGPTYMQIVVWNGPFNNFGVVASNTSLTRASGDVFKVTCIGTTITGFQNGIQQVQYTTAVEFSSGNPGMGWFNAGGAPTQSDLYFYDYSATDGLTAAIIGPADMCPGSNVAWRYE
jgi:hypothetical protein